MEENCIGGKKAGDHLCADGHIGALCEVCDVSKRHWNESWANSEEFKCGKCSEVENNVIKVVFINLWILLTMVLSVKTTIQMI